MLYIHSIPCKPWTLYEQQPVLCRGSCTRLAFWSLLFTSDHSCSLALDSGCFPQQPRKDGHVFFFLWFSACAFSVCGICVSLLRVSVHSFSFIQCVGLEKEISFKRSSASSWKRLQKMSQVDVMLKGLNWGWLNSEKDSLEFNWIRNLGKGEVSLLLESLEKVPVWQEGTESKSQEGYCQELQGCLRSTLQLATLRIPKILFSKSQGKQPDSSNAYHMQAHMKLSQEKWSSGRGVAVLKRGRMKNHR